MGLNDLLANGRTHPAALKLTTACQALEGQKDPLQVFKIETDPIISKENLYALPGAEVLRAAPYSHQRGLIGPVKFKGISEEVLEEQAHLERVGLNHRQIARLDPTTCPLQTGFQL